MAGIEVAAPQRRGARGVLDEALALAHSGEPSWKRHCYRAWLTTPSEMLRVLLGQAGEDYAAWLAHRAPALLARWRRVRDIGI